MILYLHGFRSSPHSFKARLLAERLHALGRGDDYLCPQLPPSPAAAIALAQSLIASQPPERLTLIGSSLGGYYATWLAEQTGCRAVLLNPAVDPARDLQAYIGEQSAWHDPNERFEVKPEFMGELQALACGPVRHPERYFAVIAKGDEVLAWREMVGRYPGARIELLEGGDHALSDFESHLRGVLDFLQLSR